MHLLDEYDVLPSSSSAEEVAINTPFVIVAGQYPLAVESNAGELFDVIFMICLQTCDFHVF